MNELTTQELKQWMEEGKDFQLIDVREVHEHEMQNIGGELMPTSEFSKYIDKIEPEKPVVVYCQSGNRSAQVIHYLSTQLDFDNLINLQGGILAWE